jgi:hypothetical protein
MIVKRAVSYLAEGRSDNESQEHATQDKKPPAERRNPAYGRPNAAGD